MKNKEKYFVEEIATNIACVYYLFDEQKILLGNQRWWCYVRS